MRISAPVDYSEDNITVTANALFVHFANDLSAFISDFMASRHGAAWLQNLKIEDESYRTFNVKDPAALLKDLTRNGGSKLRPAINSKIERGFQRNFYDDLDLLLGERNAWLHRQVPETKEELLDLIVVLTRVGRNLNLAIVQDCDFLQKSISGELEKASEGNASSNLDTQVSNSEASPSREVPMQVESPSAVESQAEPHSDGLSATDIGESVRNEKSQIGDVVNERLLSHSYVLHLNGDIRDRASDELLSAVNPNSAQVLGALLIARKPAGGRIRITEGGILCAFFGEQWGYLAQVTDEDWFPNHLHGNGNTK